MAQPSEKELPARIFSPFDKVFVGHYHNRTVIPGTGIEYIGSSRQHNFGEDEEKGYTVLYTDGTHEFVKNRVNMRYRVMDMPAERAGLHLMDELREMEADGRYKVKVRVHVPAAAMKSVDKAALLEAGLFSFIIQRPYIVVADPNAKPKGIFVSAFDTNPLAADFEFVLKGQEKDFQTGLDALAKMAKTYLNISVEQKSPALTNAKNVTVTAFDGPNPAGNVGVQINHISPINKGETVWTLRAEDVIFIGRLFNTGRVDLTRTIALTGSEVKKPAYCKLKVGASLTDVFAGRVTEGANLRYINGNVLTGTLVKPNGFLGAHATSLTVIPEGDDRHEFLGFIMPRTDQYSANRSYFSWLCGNKEYTLDARIKGGERHMIMSGEYDKVFPMSIFPEYLIKAIIAGDIDRMEALGIYEVAPEDFAVCEFVDSSKLELQRIVRQGLDMLRKEMC